MPTVFFVQTDSRIFENAKKGETFGDKRLCWPKFSSPTRLLPLKTDKVLQM